MAVLWRVLALIVLVASPLRLLSVGAGMADSTFREVIPMMPQIMRETFAGRVWTWRLATALLLALVAWIPAPGRLATTLIFAVSGGAACLSKRNEPCDRQGRIRCLGSFRSSGRGGHVDWRVGLVADRRDLRTRGRGMAAIGDLASIHNSGMVSCGVDRDRRDQSMGLTWTATRPVGEFDLRSNTAVEGRYGSDRDPDWRLQPLSIGGVGGRIVGACGADSQCGRRMRFAGCRAWMVGGAGEHAAATLSNGRLITNPYKSSKRHIYEYSL